MSSICDRGQPLCCARVGVTVTSTRPSRRCAQTWQGVVCVAGAVFRPSALRAARLRAGLTQLELAARTGVRDVGRVSAWERGTDQPSPVVVPALARELNVPADELYEADSSALELLRRAAGLSLMSLGEASGLGYKRVRQLEKGLTPPTRLDIARLASALEVSQARVRSAVQAAAATKKKTARPGP